MRLRPDPTNEKDGNTIAIDIDHGSGYVNVGYIASELTKYLHPLITTGKIVDVSVKHIIFRVHFARMGYSPKILIKRKGAWEKFVIYRCHTTIWYRCRLNIFSEILLYISLFLISYHKSTLKEICSCKTSLFFIVFYCNWMYSACNSHIKLQVYVEPAIWVADFPYYSSKVHG